MAVEEVERDEDQALCKYNPKVVNFVMGPERPENRARSRESRLSRPPSACRAVDERPFSSLSTGSSIEDDLEELKDKLKISHIDEVILHLRSLLEDECQTLEKDVMILQQRLEEERQYIEEVQTLPAEPSLTELKEERRILERDLQLNQLLATSTLTSKMASNGQTNLARFLDLGGSAACSLSLKIQRSPDLQHDPLKTPSPPYPKLKSREGTVVRGGLRVPGATSCAAAEKSPQEPGLSAAHRSIHQGLKGISKVQPALCYQMRNPAQVPCITSDRTASAASVTPLNSLFVPLPPKVQRPSGPKPAFRRVRTLVTNLPP